MEHHTTSLLVLLLACGLQLLSAQPYTVNEQRLPGCTTKMSIENSVLDVNRGDRGAPCVGILNYRDVSSTRRLCGEKEDFNKASAERLCYTLGLNMNRQPGSKAGMRLYDCDIYVEENAEYPVKSMDYVDKVQITDLYGQRCNQMISIDSTKCFDSCYFGEEGVASDFPYSVPESSCDERDEPWWSITCSDINECERNPHYDCDGPFTEQCNRTRKACAENANCKNTIGSWECACKAGYKNANNNPSDAYAPGGCTDINECDNPMTCGTGGQCQNTMGAYVCQCSENQLWDDESKTCGGSLCGTPDQDLDAEPPVFRGNPIEEGVYTCKEGYATLAGAATYTNNCEEGAWEYNGPCEDINECDPSQCDPNAKCVNVPGSFICRCNPGYIGDGKTCEKSDSCNTMENFGLCVNGQCTITEGKPRCSCNFNYQGIACDRPKFSTPFIVAIVAVVMVGIVMVIVVIYFCLSALSGPRLPLLPPPPPPATFGSPNFGPNPYLPPRRFQPF